MRNNNPLNIRRSGDKWLGATKVQADPAFVTFRELKWGYRAAWKVLKTYHKRLKPCQAFNLWYIIAQWAPEADGNNVKAYRRAVMALGGIGGYEHFAQPDSVSGYLRLSRVLMAMTCVECGLKPEGVDVEAIREGFRLAFPDVDLTEKEAADEETDDEI